MKSLSASIRFVCLVVLLTMPLAACENTNDYPYPRLAPMAPPEPMDEEKASIDDPSQELWRPGYWMYDGIDYAWVSGEVLLRPDPTAVWSPDHWEERNYGWAFIPGVWR